MTIIRERGRRNNRSERRSSSQRGREVRDRRKDIETFSTNCSFPLVQGYYDSLKLTIPVGTFTFDDRPTYQRFRTFFMRTNITIQDRNSYNVKFRPNDWLFTGNLIFRNSNADVGYEARIEYELNLNPTRFVHHAYLKLGSSPENFSLEELQRLPLEELLRKEDTNDIQTALDFNDNFIPLAIFKAARPFDDYLRLYVESIVTFLDDALVNSLRQTLTREPTEVDYFIEHTGIEVNKCEAYWEYNVMDALSFVNGLWDNFQSVLYNTERKLYRSNEEASEIQGSQVINNGISIYANDIGPQEMRLCVYAKLLKRVRFEIRYYRSIRRILGRREFSSDLEGTLEMIYAFRENAQQRLQKMMSALPDLNYSQRAEYHKLAEFLTIMSDIHRDYPSISLNQTYSLLINTGRVVVTNGSRMHDLMEALRREYIVETNSAYVRNDSGNTVYTLMPRYQDIIRAFREVFE